MVRSERRDGCIGSKLAHIIDQSERSERKPVTVGETEGYYHGDEGRRYILRRFLQAVTNS